MTTTETAECIAGATVTAASVSEAIATRRSIRAFSDRLVALTLLREILEKARLTPLNRNLQPWQSMILTGSPLKALQDDMIATGRNDPAEYDVLPSPLPAALQAKLHELAACM